MHTKDYQYLTAVTKSLRDSGSMSHEFLDMKFDQLVTEVTVVFWMASLRKKEGKLKDGKDRYVVDIWKRLQKTGVLVPCKRGRPFRGTKTNYQKVFCAVYAPLAQNIAQQKV